VRRLLQYDGAKRMTASEALAHPFLAPLRQPALEVRGASSTARPATPSVLTCHTAICDCCPVLVLGHRCGGAAAHL